MCAIHGAVSYRSPLDPVHLAQARDRLAHRGPDDAGMWQSVDGRVALTHRRLSVIDLTPGGHQPMLDEDGRLAIVFNGEIYNFEALRQELSALGHAFRSRSDTEVLLAAWSAWGAGCLPRLNGMFAFAIHDRGDATTPARLFLARDRVGKKPLYYRHDGDGFVFASELKALPGPHAIDLRALNHYLALGYVPGAGCIASGVHKLPPAHCAILEIETRRLETSRYWALPPHQPITGLTVQEAADHSQALLDDSIRLRLVSDVPVGVLLSGGLDSSLVTALAARSGSGRIRTFTFAQPGSPLDEAARARLIARHFDTEHHELTVEAPSLSLLERMAPLIDEPLADSSLIPAWLVCGLARTEVTVALGGDGGDELFGGYGDYAQALRDERRIGSVPKPLLRALAGIAAALPAGVRGRNRLAALRDGAGKAIVWGSPYFDTTLRRRILTRDALSALAAQTTDRQGGLLEPEAGLLALSEGSDGMIDAMTRTHFGSILPDDFLVKVDRASMAHALEMRSPLLDYRLVEFAFRDIPDTLKAGPAGTRLVQHELARRLLPSDADFTRKQGFSIPIDDWMRADGERLFEQWSPRLPPAIERRELRSLLGGLHAGRTNGARLYALLVLAIANDNLGRAGALQA
jgi:asparagine synthase (glutamine-hydrolysing)